MTNTGQLDNQTLLDHLDKEKQWFQTLLENQQNWLKCARNLLYIKDSVFNQVEYQKAAHAVKATLEDLQVTNDKIIAILRTQIEELRAR